jgi:hypothetical protein
MWRFEPGHHGVIERARFVPGVSQHSRKRRLSHLQTDPVGQAEHNRQCLGAGHTDHTNPATTDRRGNRHDGVGRRKGQATLRLSMK